MSNQITYTDNGDSTFTETTTHTRILNADQMQAMVDAKQAQIDTLTTDVAALSTATLNRKTPPIKIDPIQTIKP